MKPIYTIAILLFITCIDQGTVLGNSPAHLCKPDYLTFHSDHPFLINNKKTVSNSVKKPKFRQTLKAIFIKVVYRKFLKMSHKTVKDDNASTLPFLFSLATIILLIPGLLNIFTGIAFLILIPLFAALALWLGLKSRRSSKNFKNTFAIITGGTILILGLIISIIALATL